MPETTDHHYLIIGGGMVADAAARGIRELDADGDIGIIALEEDAPVTRPALTKKLWTDPDFGFDQVWLNTEQDTAAIRHPGEQAEELDPDRHTVRTSSGAHYRYQRLLLATGGTPKRVDMPDDERIVFFRSVDDYRRLRALSGRGRSIAVIGGSFIGTELAAALAQNDTETTLVFPEDVLGASVFPPSLAERFQRLFADAGVRMRAGTKITHGTADAATVTLYPEHGDGFDVDAAVFGLGIEPNVDLARAAGLRVDDGVVVDDRLRTDHEHIWAAGDIASYPDRVLGRTRVEHVDNARAMGTQAGRNMAGADESYAHTPYFYSVVFGNRYEAVGTLDATLQTVVDADETGETMVVYYLQDDRVVGVLLWNVVGQRDAARATIAEASAADPASLRGRIPLTRPNE